MGKNTFGKMMPRVLTQHLELMGEQIMLARKRRRQSMQNIADRATVTRLTVSKVEHGDPTVSMGIYARVLFALNEFLASPLVMGTLGYEHVRDYQI